MIKPYNNDSTKKEQVRDMFNTIAPKYDLLNHTLSLSIDRGWRRRVVKIVKRSGANSILDVATGTGDLALLMARKIKEAKVVGMDLSEMMLSVAQNKAQRYGVSDRVELQCGDAEHLSFEDGSFDCVTVAFGVRNFESLEVGLTEMARVTKDGGVAVILEFSRPRNRIFRALYEFYSSKILPRIGGLISKDRRAYEYLPASVQLFPERERFVEMLLEAGFSSASSKSLSFGIAQIYVAQKSR